MAGRVDGIYLHRIVLIVTLPSEICGFRHFRLGGLPYNQLSLSVNWFGSTLGKRLDASV
jgi:hypothetical protein